MTDVPRLNEANQWPSALKPVSFDTTPEPPAFVKFDKIPRLNRPFAITEKIDGANGQVHVYGSTVQAGSRNRWITPGKTSDNFGFAAWVAEHERELAEGLGDGTHYGEWYGQGIQRGYGMTERRFALFNCDRWSDPLVRPACCDVVPLLARASDLFDLAQKVPWSLTKLERDGSQAVPGFYKAEGIVIFSYAARQLWKVTLDNDSMSKGEAENLGLAA